MTTETTSQPPEAGPAQEPGLPVSYAGALEEMRADIKKLAADVKEGDGKIFLARKEAHQARERADQAHARAEEAVDCATQTAEYAAEGPSAARTVLNAVLWGCTSFAVGVALTALANHLLPEEPAPTLRRLDGAEGAQPLPGATA
jgi:hypothetical protein